MVDCIPIVLTEFRYTNEIHRFDANSRDIVQFSLSTLLTIFVLKLNYLFNKFQGRSLPWGVGEGMKHIEQIASVFEAVYAR